MNLYQHQFSEHLDCADSDPRRFILVASTPRCGSHMLGHAMAATGLLGVPFEYLNPSNLAEWQRRLGTPTIRETLAALMRRRTTANGVFALKAHFSHTEILGGVQNFFDLFREVSVVHIRRADVLRQAISYSNARQTGVWITGQEAVSDEARFDAEMIGECLNDIAVQNARWDAAFRAAGIRPLGIYYEDAVADIAACVTAIARHAEVIGATETIAAAAVTSRQSHAARTDDWVERYARAVAKRPSPVRAVRRKLASAALRLGVRA